MANSPKRVLHGTFNDGEVKSKSVDNTSTKRVLYGTITEEANKKEQFQNDLNKRLEERSLIGKDGNVDILNFRNRPQIFAKRGARDLPKIPSKEEAHAIAGYLQNQIESTIPRSEAAASRENNSIYNKAYEDTRADLLNNDGENVNGKSDINSDGRVDIRDLVASEDVKIVDNKLNATDMNGDGKVDIRDIVAADEIKTATEKINKAAENLEREKRKETQLKKEYEEAKKAWEDWEEDDYSVLAKGLDYIGNPYVVNLRQDYEEKEKAYIKQKSIVTELNIQNQYGMTGDEYIAQLKEEKKNATTDKEKEYYKNLLDSTRINLYGEVNALEYIGKIAKEGLLQANKGVAATADFLLGNPAKWLGFENNVFTEANNYSTYLLEKAHEETVEISKALGDDSNTYGEIGAATVAAIPDLIIAICTGGSSALTKGAQLGSKAITNANLLTKLTDDLIKTVKSPIFYTSFIRTLGVNYEENLATGKASEFEASMAAILASLITSRMEMGGFQELPEELAGTKGLWKKIYKYALSSAEEGLEEPGQTSVTNLINKFVFDYDKPIFSTTDINAVFNPKRASREFLIGASVGAILGGGQLTFSGIVNASSEAQYKTIGQYAIKSTNIQQIIDYAKSARNEDIRTIAREVDAKSITDADAGRLYQYVVNNVNEKFEDVYTVDDFNEIVSEYFSDNVPQAVRNIANAAFANKLVEMNIEPENNELYNSVQNNSQNQQLQIDGEGGIINQGGEEDGRISNQGAVSGSVEEEIYTRRESQMGKNNETINGYVTGGKGEILSGSTGKTPRRIRINHTKNSSVTFTEGTADGTDGYKAYTAFANVGIKAIYCQGPIERTVNGVTVTRTEAFTAPDGTVYISSESTLPPKQTFDHEKVHVADKTNNPAYSDYESVLCENAMYSSSAYSGLAEEINKIYFNGKYDIEDVDSYPIFMREIAAYVNQFVLSDPEYAEQTFGGMFSDWGVVVEAVDKFNTDMGADFTEPANFMPGGENGGGVDLEITDNDMYAKNPSQWSAENKNDTTVSKSLKDKLASLFGKKNDKKTVSITEIVKQIENDFNVPVSKGKFKQKAYGIYKIHSQAIRTKVSNALPTIAHELGHHLDNKYNLRYFESIGEAERILKETRPDFYNSYKPEARPREAVAEFMRDYLADRKMAKDKYPFFFEEFERRLSENGKTDLENLKMIGDKINEYYSAELRERVKAAIITRKEAKKINRIGVKLEDTLTRAETEMLDDGAAFKKISQKAYDLYYWAKKSSVRAKNTLTGYYMAGFNDDLVKQRDKDGNITKDENGEEIYVPALKFILSDIESNKMFNDFNEYLVLRHGVEWLNQDLRVFADDALNNKKYMTDAIYAFEKQYPQFKEISEKLYEWYRTFVYEYGVNSGLMTKEQYKTLVEKYPCYVPFMRNVDGQKKGFAKSGIANQNAPIKRAKGSGLEIHPPIENLVIKIEQFMKAADRNAVMQEIANKVDNEDGFGWLLEEVPPDMIPNTISSQVIKNAAKKTLKDSGIDESAADDFSNLIDELIGESITDFKIGYIQGENVVAVRRNGKRTLYQVHDENMLTALTGLRPEQFGIITRGMGKVTRLFKALTTGSNAVWSIVSNAPRDFDSAYKYGSENNPIKYTVDYIKAVASQFGKQDSDTMKLYRTLGGGYNNSFSNARELQLATKGLFNQDKNFADRIKSLFHIVDNVTKLADFVETAPRLAEFKRVYERTGDAKKAMLAAEEVTINFNRSGKFAKTLDQYLPYFNASLQGNAKYAKAIAHSFSKEGDKSFLVKSIVTGIIKTSIMFGILGLFGDEGEEEYEKLSAYKKNNFYNIYIGGGKFISIPKSQATGVFDSLLERVFEMARKEDVEWGEEIKDFAGYMWLTFGPPLVDDMIIGSTVLDLAKNEDFTGAPIVSSYYEDLEPEKQYNEKTTYIAKSIGQLFGWSPMKIDHIIESNFGVFGLINKSLGRAEKDWTLGVKTKVVADSAYSTDILNNFYDEAEDYASKAKSYPENAEYVYKDKQYTAIKSIVSAFNGYGKDDPELAREFKILARDYVDKFEKDSTINKKLLDLLEKTGNDDILYDRTFKPTYSINKVEYKMEFEEFMELIDKYYEEVEKEYEEIFEMNLSNESTEKMLIDAKERVYKQVAREYKVKR